jgi:hypothetical protein
MIRGSTVIKRRDLRHDAVYCILRLVSDKGSVFHAHVTKSEHLYQPVFGSTSSDHSKEIHDNIGDVLPSVS